jgi:thiol-disulfide isomerase/thioredoxin
MDKDDNSFAAFEWLLNVASKNTTASQRLQDVLYETINKSKRKDMIRSYIYWAKAHPDKMVNEITKFKLEGLSKSMVDAQFINIALKDTLGNTRELKDAVTTSKYTLVAIYNPDCSHCIETLPKLITIWEKYQSKGLKIFTVAAKNDNYNHLEARLPRLQTAYKQFVSSDDELFDDLIDMMWVQSKLDSPYQNRLLFAEIKQMITDDLERERQVNAIHNYKRNEITKQNAKEFNLEIQN